MRHGRLFGAPDVARFCGVDLTTLHTWARKGKIAHVRSQGGQLRFRRTDVVAFLRLHGFPLPRAFVQEPALVLLVAQIPPSLALALGGKATLQEEPSPVATLLHLGALEPDAFVLGHSPGLSRTALLRDLVKAEPRLVVAALARDTEELALMRAAGATLSGLENDAPAFARALLELLGSSM